MKVYIVVEVDCEGTTILNVFRNKKHAERFVKVMEGKVNNRYSDFSYDIESWEVTE